MNADIRNTTVLDEIFSSFKPDAVINFTGMKAVVESVADPVKYYDVNVGGVISLLFSMTKTGCNNIFFFCDCLW
jgi:UDP-glucose 4-epimerase